jgi:suppressor of fused
MTAASLDAHVDRVDGGPPRQRYRPQPARGSKLGSPLEEVTLHAVGEPAHWHLVTRGLTELEAKQSPNPKLSGWGFELTLRLEDDEVGAGPRAVSSPQPRGDGGLPADQKPGERNSGGREWRGRESGGRESGGQESGGRESGGQGSSNKKTSDRDASERKSSGRRFGGKSGTAEEEIGAPEWAVDLLTNLAAYVWTSGNAFAAGHHLDLGGPIKLPTKKDKGAPTTAITAAAVIRDPTLGVLRTPYGRVEFLQVVGLTADELELCRSWSTEGVLRQLAADDPMLVTRLTRRSLLADPTRAAEIARLAAVDGSSLTELRVASLRWNDRHVGGSVLTLGAGASRALGPALRRELIGPGAGFSVICDPLIARFTVADQAAWHAEGDVVDIAVPLAEVEGLAALFDGRTGQGRRPAWPGLRFRVVT